MTRKNVTLNEPVHCASDPIDLTKNAMRKHRRLRNTKGPRTSTMAAAGFTGELSIGVTTSEGLHPFSQAYRKYERYTKVKLAAQRHCTKVAQLVPSKLKNIETGLYAAVFIDTELILNRFLRCKLVYRPPVSFFKSFSKAFLSM